MQILTLIDVNMRSVSKQVSQKMELSGLTLPTWGVQSPHIVSTYEQQ